MTEIALTLVLLTVLLAALVHYATGDRFTGIPRRTATRGLHHHGA